MWLIRHDNFKPILLAHYEFNVKNNQSIKLYENNIKKLKFFQKTFYCVKIFIK